MKWSEADIFEFEEFFYRDLESWFSVDIACCDECYNDFISTWPHAYTADDYTFQKSGISLDCFYSGSRLQNRYSEKEFEQLIRELTCPRCGTKLNGNIWPYEFPFDVPKGFEITIQEVSAIAAKTPFLLLKNDFCGEIYSAIEYLYTKNSVVNIKRPLFRGRLAKGMPLVRHISNFDFPPAEFVSEGRYNHSGFPVLYLASDLDTCIAELRSQDSLIVEFIFTSPLRILDLANLFKLYEDKADILNCLVYSALISSKHTDQGQYKPHYVVSRFTADCAVNAGFDAIKYPSTRRAENSFNLVILNKKFCMIDYAKVIKYHDFSLKESQ